MPAQQEDDGRGCSDEDRGIGPRRPSTAPTAPGPGRAARAGLGPALALLFGVEGSYPELAMPSPFTAIRGASRHRRSRS